MSEWEIVQTRQARLLSHQCRLPSAFKIWRWGLKRGAIITCRAADSEGLIEYAGRRQCGRSYQLLEGHVLDSTVNLEWRRL